MARDALALSEIDAFYGDSHVLHRVSLRLAEGRLLGLLGRNGAGKTTTMSVTVGLLPPRHGELAVYGRRVTGSPPEAIAAQGVALVPQGRRVFRSLTVRETLGGAARTQRSAASTCVSRGLPSSPSRPQSQRRYVVSEFSWISTRLTPAPIAWIVPPGTK